MVDGPVLVAEALRSSLTVREIFTAPGWLTEAGLDDLVAAQDPTGAIEVYEVDASVLTSTLDPVHPRPLAAVVDAPPGIVEPSTTLDAIETDRPVIAAVELRDPGNVGTVIRTAEAAGFAAVIVIGDSTDPLGPKAVRASAGSILRLPVIRLGEVGPAIATLQDKGWPVLSSVVDPEAPCYDTFDLRTAAVLVGNEPHGLPSEAIRLGDGHFTIPLSDTVESLNVAAAASVLCFEAARQRRGT